MLALQDDVSGRLGKSDRVAGGTWHAACYGRLPLTTPFALPLGFAVMLVPPRPAFGAPPSAASADATPSAEPGAKEMSLSSLGQPPRPGPRNRGGASEQDFESYLIDSVPTPLPAVGVEPMGDSNLMAQPPITDTLPELAAPAGTSPAALDESTRVPIPVSGSLAVPDTAEASAAPGWVPTEPQAGPGIPAPGKDALFQVPNGDRQTPDGKLPVVKHTELPLTVPSHSGPAALGKSATPTRDSKLPVLEELLSRVVLHDDSQNARGAIQDEAAKRPDPSLPRDRAPSPDRKELPSLGRQSPDALAVPGVPSLSQGPDAPKPIPPVADQLATGILARAEVVVQEGRTDFHLRLEPPELGTVRIYVVASEQTITARLVVHDEAAHQLITSQLHSLRQSLENAGVSLGNLDVLRGGTGSQDSWQQPQQGPGPDPESAGPDSVRLKPALPRQNPAQVTPGRVDVVV